MTTPHPYVVAGALFLAVAVGGCVAPPAPAKRKARSPLHRNPGRDPDPRGRRSYGTGSLPGTRTAPHQEPTNDQHPTTCGQVRGWIAAR